MKYISSLIVVEDIEKSCFLYQEILGQKIKTDYGENIVFEGDFAIHKKEHFRGLIGDKNITGKSNNSELYFEDDKIEKVQDLLKKNNFEFVHEMKEQPWRQRVLRFYDYDGNIIEIGESMEFVAYRLFLENKSLDEISKITYLSAETVEKAVIMYSKM